MIQGFGNVGSNAARLMQEQGYKIIGIAERDGGLYNPAGIDIHQLLEYRYRNNTILGFRGAEATPSEELLVSECEILIPAATENVITSRNADKIKAKIVVEGANGPTTAVADEILAEKRIFIVPDILANAGGVTASYFEWVQDRQGYFWKESQVNEQLEDHFARQLRRRGALCRGARREQPHRGVHAGHRPRGVHHQATRHLRVGATSNGGKRGGGGEGFSRHLFVRAQPVTQSTHPRIAATSPARSKTMKACVGFLLHMSASVAFAQQKTHFGSQRPAGSASACGNLQRAAWRSSWTIRNRLPRSREPGKAEIYFIQDTGIGHYACLSDDEDRDRWKMGGREQEGFLVSRSL